MSELSMRVARGSRFRSKLDGIQKARAAWLCLECHAVHAGKVKGCDTCGGEVHHFPSQKELKRALNLLLLETARQITGLKFHPKYDLIVNGRKVATYVADASYVEDSLPVVEDTKPRSGFIDSVAALKIRMFEACYHPIKVRIV